MGLLACNILKIVLSGGDADTNAAVAGAILGAKFGIGHIPEEWRNGLLYASMLHDKAQNVWRFAIKEEGMKRA